MLILSTIPFSTAQKERLAAAAAPETIVFTSAEQLTDAQIENADVILGCLPIKTLQKAGRLRWLQLHSAGADAYCRPGALREDTILTNASGAYDVTLSEGMVGATFALLRRLHLYHDQQKQHIWRDEGGLVSAYGACVLVLGLGSIGLAYARRMKAMGSYVIGIKRQATEKPEGVDEVYTLDALDECLKRADVVASVLPGTAQTRGVMGRAQFEAMKKTAYFINVGRGSTVDTQALYEALCTGGIAGAMVDVTDPEPLPTDHPLWDAPNFYVTPHATGGLKMDVTMEALTAICERNLRAFIAGEAPENIVDRTLGY